MVTKLRCEGGELTAPQRSLRFEAAKCETASNTRSVQLRTWKFMPLFPQNPA